LTFDTMIKIYVIFVMLQNNKLSFPHNKIVTYDIFDVIHIDI